MSKEKEINLNNLIDNNIVLPIKNRFNHILDYISELDNNNAEHFQLIEDKIKTNKQFILQEIDKLAQKNIELKDKVVKDAYIIKQLHNDKNILLQEIDKLKNEIVELNKKFENSIQLEKLHNKELLDSISNIKWEFN